MARIQKKEKELNKLTRRRVKVVERTGTQIQHILTKSDPWGDLKCTRKDCLVCASTQTERTKCRSTSTVYTNTCLICKSRGTKKLYIGETARRSFRRSSEHTRDLRKCTEDSHMHLHICEEHPELEGTLTTAEQAAQVFSFKVERKHNNCLTRQVQEAVKIVRSGEAALNSKEEYSRSSIPTLTVSLQAPPKPEPTPPQGELEPLQQHATQRKKRPRTRTEARFRPQTPGPEPNQPHKRHCSGTTQGPRRPWNPAENPDSLAPWNPAGNPGTLAENPDSLAPRNPAGNPDTLAHPKPQLEQASRPKRTWNPARNRGSQPLWNPTENPAPPPLTPQPSQKEPSHQGN